MPPNDDLGPLTSSYHSYPLSIRQAAGPLLAGLIVVLLPLVAGLYQAYNAYTNFGPAAVETWSFPWFILALGIGLAWLFFLLIYFFGPGWSIDICTHGLRVSGPLHPLLPLTRVRRLPWEQISGVAMETIALKNGQLQYRASLFLEEGPPVRLHKTGEKGDIENLSELVTRIKAVLYPRLSPQVEAKFNEGLLLPFGPISIQCQYLQMHGTQLPWSQIERITIQSGYLVVELRKHENANTSKRFPVSQVPNLELLLHLIEYHVVSV